MINNMMNQNKSTIIIGSGLGGYMLAKEWRKLDATTPLQIITADAGDFYSKPLLSTALTKGKTAQALAVNNAAAMAEQLNAKIHTFCRVTSIDAEKQTLSFIDQNNQTNTLEFSRLVLATGANKIKTSLAGDAVDEIMSVNNLGHYAKFRDWLDNKKRIAILGAGLVGCEFTNDLINAGYQVDIIAPEQYPLASLVPESIGKNLITALTAKGVNWHLEKLATAIDKSNDGYNITLSDGNQVTADGVFSAIGLRPNVALAQLSNLKTQRGIVVDRYLRTSHKNIYALGDCAEVAGLVRQYVAPLLQCVRALAKILAGGSEPVCYPCMPVVIKSTANHCKA